MDEVAGAIADPVRREILEMLRADARLSAGEIAERFAISRPAVSRHLRVLRESGLVRDELVGRQRFYLLDASRLVPLVRWLAEFAVPVSPERPTGWSHRLDALETEVYRTRRERRTDVPAADPAAESSADPSAAAPSAADLRAAAPPVTALPTSDSRAAAHPTGRPRTAVLPAAGRRAKNVPAAGSTSKENTA